MNPRPLLGRADGELQSRDQSDPPPTRWSHDSGQAAGPRRRGHRLSAANDALGPLLSSNVMIPVSDLGGRADQRQVGTDLPLLTHLRALIDDAAL